MLLLQLRHSVCLGLGMATAFLAVQLVTAQQTVPFDGGIPVAPAGFEPLPIPAEPVEFDTAEVMRIRVVPVARLANPWSLAFLPDASMLVTEKEGRLRIIRNGVLDPKPIPGVPTVRVQGRSGLMEVLPHPQFATNRFVYFTYLKPIDEKRAALTLARGRFDGSAISELKDIFSCGPGVAGPSRLAWGRDGKLYMTTPSGGNGSSSQDPSTYAGKVLRLNDDGTAPADNPFSGRAGHKPEVYTFGHRNSLGLAVNPASGEMWQNEMGPNGGDEINILKPGANYGWPLVSLGRSYPGPWQSPTFSKEGFESPVVYWMPSISLSGMTFYTGSKLPKWKGDVFVGGQRTGEIPGTGHLDRILVNDKLEELRRESLLVPLRMRIRDVRQGPDELLYVLVDHDQNGGVLRIEPSATLQAPTKYPTRPPR
ncbi:MAG TPA: PQQ-dependent sugar dehydrogenase [Vicinamibacterales bacterium]|jgi:aldose sugar dehydrogenase|nr:PQQ-dependent sugar dehydrogenase [Vicinamibacterales bacterium]